MILSSRYRIDGMIEILFLLLVSYVLQMAPASSSLQVHNTALIAVILLLCEVDDDADAEEEVADDDGSDRIEHIDVQAGPK